MELANYTFAGFIMTYERSEILEATIRDVFLQTVPPEKLLIVDNSASSKTEALLLQLNDSRVCYHKVGYNAGPAGAAAIGLQLLAHEGYDWIYWGDDDDPPLFKDTFEILLKVALSDVRCGCVGAVGNYFSNLTGFVTRATNKALNHEGILEVDTIAGGMTKIVSGPMILKHNILPEEKLFFGFEELDFDLKVKNKGYKLLVDKELFWKHRVHANRVDYKRNYLEKKNASLLWRNYYSVRNLLFICFKNHLYSALLIHFTKALFKPFYNLRYGLAYFRKSFIVNYLGTYHFFIGRLGKNC